MTKEEELFYKNIDKGNFITQILVPVVEKDTLSIGDFKDHFFDNSKLLSPEEVAKIRKYFKEIGVL